MSSSTRVWGLVAAGCLLLISAATASAQAQGQSPTPQAAPPLAPGAIRISSSSGTPVLLDGLESAQLPTEIGSGTEVCLPARTVYKTEGERFVFQQWSTGANDDCITPTRPGEYRAQYLHQVLLVVKSEAPGIQRSSWVTFGQPVALEVPDVVQVTDNTRYRFQVWSDGETPFERQNTIAPMKPTVLEAKWVQEHQITVESPDDAHIQGSGWYPDGANLALRAPDTLSGESDQDRWKFSQWSSDSFPAAMIQNPQSAVTTLKVDAGYAVKAVYSRQYLVDAQSPFGPLKHDWVNDGDSVVLEAPPTADVVPDQQRLVFKRWDGMDGLLSPKITGKVDKPLSVNVVYEKQVMLTVNAPHGASGDGWHKVGDVVTVTVPGSVSQLFLLNSTLVGFGSGYPAGQSSIQVLVNEPTTLTALYRTEPNLAVLALLLLLPTLAVLVYLSVTRGWLADLRARVQERIRHFRARRKLLFWVAAEKQSQEIAAELPGRNGTHLPLPIGDEPRT